jgi:hypothetical protein
MNWKAKRPAIEIAAELIAAACVGGATGFAVWALAPLDAALVAAPAAGVIGAIGALVLMGQVARPKPLGESFTPVDFPAEADGLRLDKPVEPEPLLLDDPLPAISEDSRVVRLFAVPPTADEAAPLPAPGEMAARIEDFLGGSRASQAAAVTAPAHPSAAAADASAALHAALADIRRSLRQA